MGQLVEAAREALQLAEQLESQLAAMSAPLPSLDANGPLQYPPWSKYPEIYKTRSTLIDLSKMMYQLSLGPLDAIRSMINQESIMVSVLNVLDQHDIPQIVPEKGSVPLIQLAERIKMDQDLLERFVRFAAASNVLKLDADALVSHTALSRAMPTLSAWSRFMNRKEVRSAFAAFSKSARIYPEPQATDQRVLPWNVGNGLDDSFFGFLNKEKEGMMHFGLAMKSHANATGSDPSLFLEGFDWQSIGEGPLVDLGGGNGYLSILLAKNFPQLKVIVQDVPMSKGGFEATLPADLGDRVSFQVQDFFKPQVHRLGARVYFMRAIMHDWPDEDCARILRNLIPEVEKGAKIVICDRIIPPRGARPSHMNSFTMFMDLNMYSLLGAKERSVDQWTALFELTDPRLKTEKLTQHAGDEFGMLVVGI